MSAANLKGPAFAEIRDELERRIDSLVRELVPDGRQNGKYWIGRNPTRADRSAGSFWIITRGTGIGVFRDEAGVEGIDSGDIVKLVQYCMRLSDMSATRLWCLRWLGWSDGGAPQLSAEERARIERQRQAKIEREEREGAQALKEKSNGAFGLWLKADKLTPATFPGSLLGRYMTSRALDLSAGFIARKRELPGAIRFFADHDYKTADGELIGLPCMIALMTGADGKAQAVHRTWLKPDGSGKADLPVPKDNKPRKIWPSPTGAVIRIAKGAGNLTPEEAGRQGRAAPLILTEGIEDALAVAIAMPERRVWAAGTLGNLSHVPMLPCVSQVTICADNDWDNPQAEQALAKAVRTLRATGRRVHVARSWRGKDVNDLMKGE